MAMMWIVLVSLKASATSELMSLSMAGSSSMSNNASTWRVSTIHITLLRMQKLVVRNLILKTDYAKCLST